MKEDIFTVDDYKVLYTALGYLPVTRDNPLMAIMINLSNKIKNHVESIHADNTEEPNKQVNEENQA